ncbi:hypothetical protein KZX43_04280 [Microbacterium sp. EYE_512]|uniref:PepSY domain-containing protein n=1 Tax=Microbacterium wangchenii TaxID=2541726 RepID=A0ABX5T0V4_9MICO|nr:hypothetical protein [Microbacterium sp. EYE_512]QBR90699.1 hypothetical protein E4K62_10640 [Microbacterium wangchenii]TXK20929.1 hypothetical protein FVP99_04255 [Microbacterium wangchenii]
MAGGGIAIGAAIADEDDDDDDRQTSMTTDAPNEDDEDAAADLGDAGTSSADELMEIIDAAAAEAEGEPVAIDAERDGAWDVQFRTEAGEETEVRVAADGTATVIATEAADADDAAPTGSLDADTVEALVSAALAEVDGRVIDLEIDDDTTSPYSVTVVAQDGRAVDIALDAEMTVVTSDRD